MNRLIWIAIVMCIVLGACGGGGASAPSDSPNALTTVMEQAVLGGVTPVNERIAQALEPAPAPAVDVLPPLPGVGITERRASEAQQAALDGADYCSGMKSDNAVVEGTSLHITAEAGSLGWAVYQIPLEPGATLTKLTIAASNGNFSGFTPGYWVGFANYSTATWSDFVQKHSTETPFVKSFNLATAEYLSPFNNLYIAVLTDGQEFTIDSVALEYDLASWQHIEFAEGASNAGWTPALAYTHGAGSLMVVYADYNTGKARYGVWDPLGDFATASSWAFMDVDPLREPGGEDAFDVSNATCKWLDLTQDPVSGEPRISLVYDGAVSQTGGDTDSVVGLSVYVKGATALFLNYWLGSGVYGGGYTSVDYDTVDDAYAVAHYVANEGWAPPDDINLRIFHVNDPKQTADDYLEPVIKSFSNLYFNTTCYYPHMRCLGSKHYAFCTNGNIYGFSVDGSNWDSLLYNDGEEHTTFGSVAINKSESFWGYTTVRTSSGNSILRFVEDLENPSAPIHDVDTATGSGWIGATQLAYKSDGNPGIAYTKYTGSGVEVKLAEYDGSQWTIETVSTVPCQPSDTSDREAVLVDLDYNILDSPALIWNQINGASCVAHVATRLD